MTSSVDVMTSSLVVVASSVAVAAAAVAVEAVGRETLAVTAADLMEADACCTTMASLAGSLCALKTMHPFSLPFERAW